MTADSTTTSGFGEVTSGSWDESVAARWSTKVPPVRPSFCELAAIEETLRSLPGDSPRRALLLGSTPELRDLCYRLSLRLTVADYGARTFERLGATRYHPLSAEDLVEGNWTQLENTLPRDARFRVVLGDLSLGVVPELADRRTILAALHGALAPTGVVALRCWVFQPGRFPDIAGLLARNVGADVFGLLSLPLLFAVRRADGACFNDAAWHRLREWTEMGLAPHDALERFAREGWPSRKLPDWIPEAGELEELLTERFRIVSVLRGRHAYHDLCPIYLLAPRQT